MEILEIARDLLFPAFLLIAAGLVLWAILVAHPDDPRVRIDLEMLDQESFSVLLTDLFERAIVPRFTEAEMP